MIVEGIRAKAHLTSINILIINTPHNQAAVNFKWFALSQRLKKLNTL